MTTDKRLSDEYCESMLKKREVGGGVDCYMRPLVAEVMARGRDNAALRERVRVLERMEAKAWGIRFCCDGRECGCRGLPVDPPIWWQRLDDELAASEEWVRVLEEERGLILLGLRHPNAPHIDALLSARSLLTLSRDEGDDAAEHQIDYIDRVLDQFGYKHFSEGGDRYDEHRECVAALLAALATTDAAKEPTDD